MTSSVPTGTSNSGAPVRLRRALLSVSDKTGIVDFAKALHALGIKLLSTGGTAQLLAKEGLPVTEVAEVTSSLKCWTAA